MPDNFQPNDATQTLNDWTNGKKLGQFGTWLGDSLFGNGKHPGIFGTGQYEVDPNAALIPGANGMQQTFAQGAADAGTRAGPAFDNSGNAAGRTQQQSLADALTAQANGQGPSLAQGQLQAGTDRNLKQSLALAQTVPQNGSALRNIAAQRAAISQQGAADSGQLRLQEQLQSRNQLGQVLSGMRGQDIGVAQGNQQAALQQQTANDQMVRFYQASGMSLAEAQQQAAMDMQRMKMAAYQGSAAANSQLTGQVVGGIGSVAAGAAGGF